LPELLGEALPQRYGRRIAGFPDPSGALVLYGVVARERLPQHLGLHAQLEWSEPGNLFVSISAEGDGRAPAGQATLIASVFTPARPWFGLPELDYQQRKQDALAGIQAGLQRLLGVDPQAPFSQGPLQDPHWVQGMFGYFPAYLLGAMVAAQCFAALRRDVPDLQAQGALGDWLAPRIWQQGARHDLDAMMQLATGEPLSDNALRTQLEQRHGRTN
jgi:hypothetical protein